MNEKKPMKEAIIKNASGLADLVLEMGNHNTSDAICVLIGVQFISNMLEKLLRVVLKSGRTTDELLKDGGLLGEVSARAKICYSFIIIDKKLYNNIIALIEIRNKVAHSTSAKAFGSEEVKKLHKKLNITDGSETHADANYKMLMEITSNAPEERMLFLNITAIVIVALAKLIASIPIKMQTN